MARFSHAVVKIEVPIAPAVMRTKLLRPAAAGSLSGVRPEKMIACSGMKKKAIAAPCSTVGIRIVLTSTWTLKRERIQSTRPKPRKATVASLRGSILLTFLPTQGDRMIASTCLLYTSDAADDLLC